MVGRLKDVETGLREADRTLRAHLARVGHTIRYLSHRALDSWLWMVTKERIEEDWKFQLPPYDRTNPPPQVNTSHLVVFG